MTGGELARTPEQQAIYFKTGRSKTMNSIHLKRCAIDLNFFKDNWGMSLRHQYWPEIKAAACITAPAGIPCYYGGVQTDYHLFALSGNYQFGENYTLRVGIENLLDKEPPMNKGDPTVNPFPTAPTHVGGGATYDPLGRRAFVSVTMSI